jgi:hypothetical protein
MEKLIKYNQKRFPNQYEFNCETLKFEYADKGCDIRILKEVNDLRYCGWGLQAIWDLSICFPWGWIHKTLRRKADDDISKVIEYVNKKIKKYNYEITYNQWEKVKKDFTDHMKNDYKYIHRNVSAPTKTFNYGFNNTYEEYIIKGITKRDIIKL